MTDSFRPALTRDDLVVVIPALNEALRIRDVVEGALAECPRVVVIDDGSDDGTADRIADHGTTHGAAGRTPLLVRSRGAAGQGHDGRGRCGRDPETCLHGVHLSRVMDTFCKSPAPRV